MLNPYPFIEHDLDTLQKFTDYIFFDVWCNASKLKPYCFDLYDGNPELRNFLHELEYDGRRGSGDIFLRYIENIYYQFTNLNDNEINRLKKWYKGNNDIENACADSSVYEIVRYPDIENINASLSKNLEIFFSYLYEHCKDRAAAIKRFGSIFDRFQKFVRETNFRICPFCGLSELRTEHHTTRDAYDHYLPKDIYPFNSINFHNLSPACNTCNSSYKLRKDPLHGQNGQRRKAFYPYTNRSTNISVKVSVVNLDDQVMKKDNISIVISSPNVQEAETWKELYGIEERYVAKCLASQNYWIESIVGECQNYCKEPQELLGIFEQKATRFPLDECNFLKSSFLNACQAIGLLDPIPR